MNKIYAIAGVIAVVIAAYLLYANAPGQYDSFARCVAASGAKMYGAYWCPHCNAQKEMFGNSWRLMDYVECSLPGGQGETAICTQAGITSYPTWVFKDGSENIGAMSFDQLGQKTNCSLT